MRDHEECIFTHRDRTKRRKGRGREEGKRERSKGEERGRKRKDKKIRKVEEKPLKESKVYQHELPGTFVFTHCRVYLGWLMACYSFSSAVTKYY